MYHGFQALNKDLCKHSSLDSFINDSDSIYAYKIITGDQLIIHTPYGNNIHSCNISDTDSMFNNFHRCSSFRIEGAKMYAATVLLRNGSHSGGRIIAGHINGSVSVTASIIKYTNRHLRIIYMISFRLNRSSDSTMISKIYRTECKCGVFHKFPFNILHYSNRISSECQEFNRDITGDKSFTFPESTKDHVLTFRLTQENLIQWDHECTFHSPIQAKHTKTYAVVTAVEKIQHHILI